VGYALDLDVVQHGEVHSTFEHAINLTVDGCLWTLLARERSDMPFGIRVVSADLGVVGVSVGDAVTVRAGYIGLGPDPVVVDCRTTPRWTPEAIPIPRPELGRRLSAVAAVSRRRAWPESRRMAEDVVEALGDPTALADVLSAVVGRGPGLTPAGDDVLVGIAAVVASESAGSRGQAATAALRHSIRAALPGTTDVSAHMLRQACNGLIGRAIHELVSALVGSNVRGVRDRARRVVGIGATSGADTCAGLLAAAPLYLPFAERTAA
jgi:hypothetical protein